MNDIKEIVDRDGNAVDRIPVSTGDAPSLDSVDPLVLPSGVLQFTSDLAGEMHRCAQGMAIPAELVTTASKATTAREIMLLDAMRQNASNEPLRVRRSAANPKSRSIRLLGSFLTARVAVSTS